jgi:non-ribosomal peptide synthetase component F
MGRPDALHELVARSVDRSRQSAAVRQGDLVLTYAELQGLAVQLAAELACAGAGEGQVVALDLPSSPRLIAAMLAAGILGAAFLPWDRRGAGPHAPRAEDLDGHAPVAVVTENAVRSMDRGPSLAGRPAYVSFAAGPAGPTRRRAIVIGQRAAVEHIESAMAEYRLRPGDRQLQLASPASDLAVEEIFGSLAAGATLVLPEEEFEFEDVAGFLRLVDERGVTVLHLPVELCDAFGRQLRQRPRILLPRALRLVVAGGGAMGAQAEAAWCAAARQATFRAARSRGPSVSAIRPPVSLTR